MARQKILVTGSGGQLGQELLGLSDQYRAFDFDFRSRDQLALDNPDQVASYFEKEKPSYCLNCAAYTAVDRAESEPEKAFLINGHAVGWLAESCQKQGTRLIHLSTDYVFAGDSPKPLREEDPTGPINVYGASKLLGETLAFQHNPHTIIFRTAWVYSVFGNNFVKTMIRLMGERPSLNVIDDQIGSPTYAADLARVILDIVQSGQFLQGIYHYSNEGRISWYDFALEIGRLIGSSCQINPIATSGYPTAAKRPQYSLLDKSKIVHTYGVVIPDWKTSLSRCLEKLRSV
jgi:dTDP-4-dehydrorhamnose reductase